MIKLGIVMDPIATINIKKDTSFAMLLEAQRRGYELHYMEMNDLYLINGEARARTRTLSVEQNYDKWYDFTGEQDLPLADLDVILMRKDPPFDTEFIYATYILERAEEKGTLIVNKPQSLRDCNEKLFTAWFSELTPETLVTRNKAQLKAFWEKHGDIIMKPLDGMGGASIFRVKAGDPNLGVITETLTELGSRYCMAQNYLPAIKDGDKRVLVVDGAYSAGRRDPRQPGCRRPWRSSPVDRKRLGNCPPRRPDAESQRSYLRRPGYHRRPSDGN